jgi:hypothetical protein
LFGLLSTPDLNSRGAQQAISHAEAATIFLNHFSVHLASGHFSIDRFVQLGIERLTNRLD